MCEREKGGGTRGEDKGSEGEWERKKKGEGKRARTKCVKVSEKREKKREIESERL